ncbi:SLC13 family permease [Gordonia sp. FQ]|uniref:SLC13 family permease n=1 Tax=Gordonia sp. FQ TaxID=3446634 RepID=UPI003F858A49
MLAVPLLAAVIVAAVAARRFSPAWIAVPAAGLVVVTGMASWRAAADELVFLGPTLGFLAAMLVVAQVCARTGVFIWVGAAMARLGRGSPVRLLQAVFAVAAATTATLSLDTTIVLLTPVVVLAAYRTGARIAAPSAATAHLANSASTLLPVSNLTNLLAFGVIGVGFAEFAGLMALPWLVAIGVEYAAFRWFFRGRLGDGAVAPDTGDPPARAPRAALIGLGLLLVAFVAAGPLHLPLAAVAGAGALVMVLPSLLRSPVRTATETVRAANIPFLLFVAALGVVVLPVREGPAGHALAGLVPSGSGFLALLGVAALAAVAANLFNNLPAVLLLLPVVADRPGMALAMLLGVNIGPNLTYFGSLANLLWREMTHRAGARPSARQYTALGLLTVPPALVCSVAALWVALHWVAPHRV